VAVTRARRQLYLSRVRRRRLSGQELPGMPSRFLRDLPAEGIEQIVTSRPPEYTDYSSEGRGPWGGRWSRGEPEYPLNRPVPKRPVAAAPGARRKPGELTVEYDGDAAPGPGLQVGSKLRHPSFGLGEVRAWQGQGAELKVTIKFPGVGVKTILARFLSNP